MIPGAHPLPCACCDGVEDAAPDAVEVAVGLELGVGQRVLGADVLAAAALEDQPHLEAGLVPLLAVHGRDAGRLAVAGVLVGQRVDRVGAQQLLPRRLAHRLLERGGEHPRRHPHRVVDPHQRRAGVLADRLPVPLRHLDVREDRVERLGRQRPRRLGVAPALERREHVGRELGGRVRDHVDELLGPLLACQHRGSLLWLRGDRCEVHGGPVGRHSSPPRAARASDRPAGLARPFNA